VTLLNGGFRVSGRSTEEGIEPAVEPREPTISFISKSWSAA